MDIRLGRGWIAPAEDLELSLGDRRHERDPLSRDYMNGLPALSATLALGGWVPADQARTTGDECDAPERLIALRASHQICVKCLNALLLDSRCRHESPNS